MTRTLLLLALLAVLLLPATSGATFESPIFDSPVFEEGRIYAQAGSVYLLPVVCIGDPTK